MIHFFRKIRQHLISENKISRYLLYAIGEIVLVVIGILIALQINMWNEERKSKTLEEDYYCKLLEDVEQDAIQIEKQILKSEERLVAANEMLRLVQSDKVIPERVMEQTLRAISLITYTFRPNMAAFEDLKSSGNLNILRDYDIKKQITEYYSMLDGMIDVMDTNADGTVKLFYDKENYTEIGWQYLDFVQAGIDTAKIDMRMLKSENFSQVEFKETMTSDAIFYIGSNARIKYLYELVLPDILIMQDALSSKCLNIKN